MKRNLRRSTSKMMAGMMITMSIFSDVSVNAQVQDMSTDALDVVDQILSDETDTSSEDSASEDSQSQDSASQDNASEDSQSEDAASEDSEAQDNSSEDSEASVEDADQSAEDKSNTDESVEDNVQSDKDIQQSVEDNSNSSSSSSSDSSSEEITVEETTQEVTEETTEETTQEVTEENTEETTQEVTEENTEETVEQTTEEKVEETVEQTTEKTEEANSDQLLGGVLDEKDEAEALFPQPTVTVYKGTTVDGSTAAVTTAKVKLDAGAVKFIEKYNDTEAAKVDASYKAYLVWTIAGTDGGTKIDDISLDGSSFDGSINITTTATTATTTFTAKIVYGKKDASGAFESGKEVTMADNVAAIKVKCINTNITTQADTVDGDRDIVAGSPDFIEMNCNDKKALTITVDRDILNNQATDGASTPVGYNGVKWEVLSGIKSSSTTGELETSSADVVAIADTSAGAGAATIDCSQAGVDEDKNTIYLTPVSIGVAYLRATVGGVVIYQGKVVVKGEQEKVEAENYNAYIGEKVILSAAVPSAKKGTATAVTWVVKDTNSKVVKASGTSIIGSSTEDKIISDATNSSKLDATTNKTYTTDVDINTTTNTSDLYITLDDDDATNGAAAGGTLEVSASVNGVEIYKANVTTVAKPTIAKTAVETNRTDLKVKDTTAKKIEIPSFESNHKGTIEWKIYKGITVDASGNVTGLTGEVTTAAGNIELCATDSKTANDWAATQTTGTGGALTSSDASMYVRATATTEKISAYYVQATLNGVPIYIGKVYVNPAKAATETITPMFTGSEKDFSFKSDSSIPDDSTMSNKSIVWKLQTYTVDGSGKLTVTGTNTSTTYVKFANSADDSETTLEMDSKELNGVNTVKLVSDENTVTPAGTVVMLSATIQDIEIQRWRINTVAKPSITFGTDNDGDNTPDASTTAPTYTGEKTIGTSATGIKIKTANAIGKNFANIKWQVYTNMNCSAGFEATDSTNPVVKLSTDAAGTAKLVTVTGTDSLIDSQGYGSIYVHANGIPGIAYVAGFVDDVAVAYYKISVGADVEDIKEITIFDGDKYELSVEGLTNSVGKTVTWGLYDSAFATLVTTPEAAKHVQLNGTLVNKATSTVGADGKAKLSITANSGTADVGANSGETSYIMALVDDAPVYKAQVKFAKRNYKASDGTTDVASDDLVDDTNGNALKEKTILIGTTTDQTVTLTNLGAATHTNINWTLHDKGTDGQYKTAEGSDIIQFTSDTTTSIEDGSSVIKFKAKSATAQGAVKVKGVSANNPATVIYEFEVLVTSDVSTIPEKEVSIYASGDATNGVNHKLEMELTDDQAAAAVSSLQWRVEDADGAAATGTPPTLDPNGLSIAPEVRDGKNYIHVTVNDKNATAGTAFYIAAYSGDPADKVKVCRFKVNPITKATSGTLSATPAGFTVGATTPIELKVPDQVVADGFENVTWYVANYTSGATPEYTPIDENDSNLELYTAEKSTTGVQSSTTSITTPTNKPIYAYLKDENKLGSVYVMAKVDDVQVCAGELKVLPEEEITKTLGLYVGEIYKYEVDLTNIAKPGDKIEWKVADNTWTAKTGASDKLAAFTVNGKDLITSSPYSITVPTSKKVTLNIKATAASATNTPDYIIGVVNGVTVCKITATGVAKPTALPTIKEGATTLANTANNETSSIIVTSPATGVPELTFASTGAPSGATKTIDIDLGTAAADITDFVQNDMTWTYYKRTKDGYSTTVKDNSIVDSITDNGIVGGKMTAQVKIKPNAAGIVKVVGTSSRATSSLPLVEFEVVVKPDNVQSVTKDLVIGGTAAKHTFEVQLDDFAKRISSGKNLAYKVDTTTAAGVTVTGSKTGPTDGKLTLTLNDNHFNTSDYTVDVYIDPSDIADPSKDGVKIYTVTIHPIKTGTGGDLVEADADNPTEKSISFSSLTPIELDLPTALPSSDLGNIEWTVTNDDYETLVANSKAIVKLDTAGFTVGATAIPTTAVTKLTTTIDPITKKSANKVYLYSTKVDHGTAYVAAKVSDTIVAKYKITVGENVQNSYREENMFVGAEKTITIPLTTKGINGKVVFDQISDGTAKNFTFNNEAAGAPATVDITGTSPNFSAVVKVKAPAADAKSNIITASIDGSEIYRIKLTTVAAPTAANVKVKVNGDENAITAGTPASLGIKTDSQNIQEVEVSGLGNVNSNVEWSVYDTKLDASNNIVATEALSSSGIAKVSNVSTSGWGETATSGISGGVSKFYIQKQNKVGQVMIVGKADGLEVYRFVLKVNPSDSLLSPISKDIFKTASKTYLFETLIDTSASTSLSTIAGKEIDWKVEKTDGTTIADTVLKVDTANSTTILSTPSNRQPINASIVVGSADLTEDAYTIYAVVKDTDVKLVQFDVTTHDAPTLTNAVNTNVTTLTASTQTATISTDSLGGNGFPTAQWQLYSDDNFTIEISDASTSPVKIGNGTASSFGDSTSCESTINATTNKHSITAAFASNKAIGTIFVQATVGGVPVYKGKIISNPASAAPVTDVKIYNGNTKVITTPDLPESTESIKWYVYEAGKATDDTASPLAAAGCKYKLNGEEVSTNGVVGNTEDKTLGDGSKVKISKLTLNVPAADVTADTAFDLVAKSQDGNTTICVISVSSIQPEQTKIISYDGSDGAEFTDANESDDPTNAKPDVVLTTTGVSPASTGVKVTGLKSQGRATEDEIKWTVKSKNLDGTYGDDKGIVSIVDNTGAVLSSSPVTSDNCVIYLKPTINSTAGSEAALGTAHVIGKVGDVVVSEFDVIVKPDSSNVGSSDVDAYANFSNFAFPAENINKNLINAGTGSAQLLFGGENVQWVSDSDKVIVDEKGSTSKLQVTSGTPNEAKLTLKIASIASDFTGTATVSAYLGNPSEGIKIHEFKITIKSPNLTENEITADKAVDPEDTTNDGFGATQIVKTFEADVINTSPVTWTVTDESGNALTKLGKVGVNTGSDASPTPGLTTNYTPTPGADGSIKAKVSVVFTGYDDAYITGTVAQTDGTAVPIAKIHAYSYKTNLVPTEETKLAGTSDLAIEVSKTASNVPLTAVDDIDWEVGTYEVDKSGGYKDTKNESILNIVKDGTNDPAINNGVLTAKVQVNTPCPNAYVKAIDANGKEAARWHITIKAKPGVASETIDTLVGKQDKIEISGLDDFKEVKWYISQTDGNTAAPQDSFTFYTSNDYKTNPYAIPASANVATAVSTTKINNGSSALYFKAAKSAILNNTATAYTVTAKVDGQEVGSYTINVGFEEISEGDVQRVILPIGVKQKIDFDVSKVDGLVSTDNIYWISGKVKDGVDEDTPDVAEIYKDNATGTTNSFASNSSTASYAIGTIPAADKDGKITVSAYAAIKAPAVNATVPECIYLKGILNGKVVCKVYMTPSAQTDGSTQVTILDKMYTGIEETISVTTAGNKVEIGELSEAPKFDSTITSNSSTADKLATIGIESAPTNKLINFIGTSNNPLSQLSSYTTTDTKATIKGVGTGWAYIKEIDKTSNKVLKIYYVHLTEAPLTKIDFDSSRFTNKKNSLKEITDSTAIGALNLAKTPNKVYELNLYEGDSAVDDKYLVNNELSQFVVQPKVYSDNKIVNAVGEASLSFDASGVTTDNLATLEINSKGENYLKIDTADSSKTGVLYIETASKKAIEQETVSGNTAAAPLQRIAVVVKTHKVPVLGTVNADENGSTENTWASNSTALDGSNTNISTQKALTTTTKTISAGDILKVVFDGAKLSVAKVKADLTLNEGGSIAEPDYDNDFTGTLPAGKWVVCANKFSANGTLNGKVSSAAKLSTDDGATFKASTLPGQQTIYLGNTKAKSNDSNLIYLRYVNEFDSNIVYLQIPVSIVPATTQTEDFTVNAKGMTKTTDNKNLITINMGEKASISAKFTGASTNKVVDYVVNNTAATESIDGNTNASVVAGDSYIQVNSKGVITPLKATAANEYVKLNVQSADNASASQVVYIKINDKVNNLVLSQTSVSLAPDITQNVVLRANPSYEGSSIKVKVETSAAATPTVASAVKVYEDADCTDEIANGDVIDLEDGMKDLYFKLDGAVTKIDKTNNFVKFTYGQEETDASSNTVFVPVDKVKPVTLTAKKVNIANNVSSALEKAEFDIPMGVPFNLKTKLSPATASNVIIWDASKTKWSSTIGDDAPNGGLTQVDGNAAWGTECLVSNSWFTPLKSGTFKLVGKTQGENAEGKAIDIEYIINVYKPVKSLKITGEEYVVKSDGKFDTTLVSATPKPAYKIYNGYLKDGNLDSNVTGTTLIPGGKKIKLTIADPGSGSLDEKITWTSSDPLGLYLSQTDDTGTTVDIVTNVEGTYTVTGTTQYSKQKFTFKVMVGKNLVIEDNDQNINDDLNDVVENTAAVTFKLKSGNTLDEGLDKTTNIIKKNGSDQIVLESSNVAFEKISFTSSNSKYLSVSANGTIKAKGKTPENEVATVTVNMTGTTSKEGGKDVKVNVVKQFNFIVEDPAVEVTNLADYVKTTNGYLQRGKNYSFSAKISGLAASQVKTVWKFVKFGTTADANTITSTTVDADALAKFKEAKEYGTATVKANSLKLTFGDTTKAPAGDYYVYPVVYDLNDSLIYDPSKPDGTNLETNLTKYAQKIKLVGNVINTVSLSQTAINAVSSTTGTDFLVYAKAFAADGQPVTDTNITWSSSNRYIASVAPGAAVAAGSGEAATNPYLSAIKVTTGKSTGTATITGLIDSTGKKISIKVNVKDATETPAVATNIKINGNKALTLKLDPNSNLAVKQVATTYFDTNGKAVTPTTPVGEEVWTVTPLNAEGEEVTANKYTVTVTNNFTDNKATIAYSNSLSESTAPLAIDAAGNIIGKASGQYKLTKTVKFKDAAAAIEMPTLADNTPTFVKVTIK